MTDQEKISELMRGCRLAVSMLNHLRCVHGSNCDGKGTLNSGEQCQWCDERMEIASILQRAEGSQYIPISDEEWTPPI